MYLKVAKTAKSVLKRTNGISFTYYVFLKLPKWVNFPSHELCAAHILTRPHPSVWGPLRRRVG